MSEPKYAKYIVYKPKPDRKPPKGVILSPDLNERMTTMTYLDNEYPKGAFLLDVCWFWAGSDTGPQAHTHDFDEVLTFYGTNPEDPWELCGEVEMWIDDEKYMINKSCAVFIPSGLQHCPMIVRKAERPIFHFGVGLTGMYNKTDVK
jgi:mannose-6-phosphate isomerase-like protein (cupin superfamily)